MADSTSTTDGVPASADSVRDHSHISQPWALIAACGVVIITIVVCVILVFAHLQDEDVKLFRIDQNLCKVAIHDAKVDQILASKSHIRVKIEVPIDCTELQD